MINDVVLNLINNNDFEINVQECFDEMFLGVCNPILSGVFLSFLKTKEETTDDILSGIKSARNAIKKISLNVDYDFLIENICLDTHPNYLDITFAVDVICATCEIGTVRAISQDFEYKNNCFNTIKVFDIDINNFNIEDFEETHFLYNYISQDNPYLKYTKEVHKALPYKTILDIIDSFLNPYNIKNCTVALSDKTKVEQYAKICIELGYVNSVIFSGGDLPYVSIENETNISEAWKYKIFSYKVTPDLLGITPNSIEALKVENYQHGMEIIQDIFKNKLKNSCYDAIIINAGLALYITKKSKSLMDGINLARKMIDEGKAYETLMKIKNKLLNK